MNSDGGDGKRNDGDDPHISMPTARRMQRLSIDGLLASHVDSGTPGPHLRLCSTDGQDLVIRTDQVPHLVDALSVVADRIDRAWAHEGDDYAADVVLRSPDPQDDAVMRQRHVDHLKFVQRVADNSAEVVRLLMGAETIVDALEALGALLQTDQAEVMARLARFDMLSLTRARHMPNVRICSGTSISSRNPPQFPLVRPKVPRVGQARQRGAIRSAPSIRTTSPLM